ncbi:MAG: hypothetical protein IJ566_06900 [Cardiobacteriaceae bacterium]|nr:hypothetical protein [Cardiobacteriaceae bacterium]
MKNRAITLLGHSGVGKTTLAALLASDGWFHYSGDFRIATRYLDEEITSWLAEKARDFAFFADLQQKAAIKISPKVSIDNIAILSAYIGKLGRNNFAAEEFFHRQRIFALAEKRAMFDVGQFMDIAKRRYGKEKFINDAGGSLCEYGADTDLMDYLAEKTTFVYLEANADLNVEIERRALLYPKPICYDPEFLLAMIREFGEKKSGISPDEFDSDEFIRYLTPQFLAHRSARYRALAEKYGVILPVEKVWQCKTAGDFEQLLDEGKKS